MEAKTKMTPEDEKNILDAIKTMKEIDKQIQNPDRQGMIEVLKEQGMIEVLKEAKKKALFEITLLEAHLPKSDFKPFEKCDNDSLYNNLPLYKKGIVNYCINKFGEEVFNEYLKRQRCR